MSSQAQQIQKQRLSDLLPQNKTQVTFMYQIANMKAMKILVLIKISHLNYHLQQLMSSPEPFFLKTSQGQLHKQYQIINYIINDSKQSSRQQELKIYQNIKDQNMKDSNDVGHDSQIQSQCQIPDEMEILDLGGQDIYIHAKMVQQLYQLRMGLFPLLQQFYKYLLGHQKIRKVKYESLINKIKTEIAKLDVHINEHSDVYESENSFLNIILACELFMGCKFVFQQNFRKFKYSLFSKYQKISRKSQFQEIYGKTTLCLKEYVPPEFEVEQQKAGEQKQKTDEVIPPQIVKISQNMLSMISYDNDRNQLLYNYFRSVLTQNDHKKCYFPYFWLMYQSLSCHLIQIIYQCASSYSLQQLIIKLKDLQFQLLLYFKPATIDYGIVCIYQHENQKNYYVKGNVCLASKTYNQFKHYFESRKELADWKFREVQIQDQQKRDVENVWDNIIENYNYDGVITCSVLYL